jgi:outer membrane receptor protein involved in Fe transport
MLRAAYTHQLAEAWALSGVFSYVGKKNRVPGDTREAVDDYVTLDLAAQYRHRASGTTVGISAKNVLDERYALPAPAGTYPADFVQPGRTFFLNVAQEF